MRCTSLILTTRGPCSRGSQTGIGLAIDDQGHFAKSNPKYFERVTPLGAIPTLIYAGGAPIAVGSDGALYYGSGESNGDPMFPGGIELSRIWPNVRQSKVSEQLRRILQSWDDGITSLAAGPDNAVYRFHGSPAEH